MESTKRGDPAPPSLPSRPPVYHPQPLQEPELPGARVPPGLVPHCEPGVDPSLWAWPPSLADGPGGSLQWGFPGGGSP
eukprot:4109995-Prorocentrum_lima.AAC.1